METLWNILTRWKKPKMLKEGTDYTFVNSDNGNVTGVYMLQGKYKGVL